jgi:hypothetical protein
MRSVTALHLSLVGAAVSLALGIGQLLSVNTLFGEPGTNLAYDQGVYYGAALRVTSGALPYQDFTLVHPPGILVLLQPEALIGRLIGTGAGLALAQIVTVLVVAANAFLAGYLVRSCGRSASLIASLALALWPFAVHVNALVELEPYLMLFTFVALHFVTSTTSVTTKRRLLFGGLAIGMAMSVKVWGLYPFVGLSLILVLQHRAKVLPFFFGAGSILALLWGPFLALCPSTFLHDVVIAQVHRQGFVGTASTTLVSRFLATSGLGDIFYGAVISTSTVLVIAIFGVFLLGLGLTFGLRWKNRTTTEWVLFATCFATAVGVLTMHAPNYTTHYAYVASAALAPLLGLLVAKIVHLVDRLLVGEMIGDLPTRELAASVAIFALFFAVVVFVPKVAKVTKFEYASSFNVVSDLKDAIAFQSCTLSDFPNDLIAADRYLSSKPDCSQLTDPFGMYLANDNGNQPHAASAEHPIPQAFSAKWFDALQHTDVVVQSVPFSSYFPWDEQSTKWFAAHFTLTNSFSYNTLSGMAFYRYVYVRNR